jgi:hypothetical protein
MKTKVQLGYFLRKRGVSLKKLCRENNINNSESLCKLLDEAGVDHPMLEEMKDLFEPARKKRAPVVANPKSESSVSNSEKGELRKPERQKKSGQNRSRRKSRGKNRSLNTSPPKSEG